MATAPLALTEEMHPLQLDPLLEKGSAVKTLLAEAQGTGDASDSGTHLLSGPGSGWALRFTECFGKLIVIHRQSAKEAIFCVPFPLSL